MSESVSKTAFCEYILAFQRWKISDFDYLLPICYIVCYKKPQGFKEDGADRLRFSTSENSDCIMSFPDGHYIY